jgi:hypothetical protein
MATNNSINNKLGPSNSLLMSSTGSMNLPQQPCFNYYLTTTQTNITGNGTVYTVPFDQPIINQNGNLTDGVFTAPADGNYLFTWGITLDTATILTADTFTLVLTTTSAEYFGNSLNPSTYNPGANGLTINGSLITSMVTGHTAQIDIRVYGLIANTVSILGNGAPVVTYFTGSMLN